MPLRTVDFSMEGAGRTQRGATVFLCPHSRRCLLNNRDFGVGCHIKSAVWATHRHHVMLGGYCGVPQFVSPDIMLAGYWGGFVRCQK